MRRKWFPFFLVILLVTSPFASVSEVYAMSHSSKEDEQNNDPEERNKESDVDEQDSSTDEAVSEEIKLTLGDDDEKIQDLKEDLTELGFAALEKPTTYYGLHTEEAVKAFQEFYDIEDTGVADEDTLLQIEYILSDDSFDREEHLEFSKPEEYMTEEEEVEELPEAEESSGEATEEETEAEAEESSGEATEEETEAEAEESSEEATEEETEAEAEESSGEATEEETEAEAEESSEEATEEETEAEAEESSEEATEEETEAEAEESSEEATEETEAEAEESSEEATEETEAEAEESSGEATEEETEAEAEESSEEATEETEAEAEESSGEATVFSANSTYKKGDRHQEIIKLKKQLNAIGFGYITETNLFGSFMETQVKRFQSYYGLTANGQMNQATKNKLNSVYNSPLQRGKRHNDIPEIKRQLNSLGYGHISVTTLFGSFMETKIKQFQKDHGLRVNGIADEVTVGKLKELAPKDTYQRGDRHAEIIQLKKQLNAIGFGYITETNLYGSFMETQVKRFQSYYGLSATGKMNKATKDKLNSVYNHPLQKGKRHNDIPEIKRQLNSLGYGHISVTTLFGSFMETKIKQFQKDHGLRVNGIADEVTVGKLKELAPKDTYQRGDRHAEIVQLKKQLNAIGFGYITETNLYGSFMETQVKRFQSYYGLSATGKINKATKDKLNSVYNSPFQRGKRHNDIPAIKRQLNTLGYGYISVTTLFGSYMESQIKQFQRDNNLRVNGIADERTLEALDEAISNRWVVNHETYDVTFNQALNTQMDQLQQTDMYRNDPAYVHKNYVDGSNRTTANVNVRASASNSSHIYGQISKGTQVTILGSTGNWYRISYNAWRNPTRSDVSSYLNPDNNDIFQHLDLTSSVGVTASDLNSNVLSGKGILAGRGQAFITAGNQHSVNEIYLISHALLETGNGSSALARGIEVGVDSSGNPVVVTSSNRSSLRNIKTTYNMYGIGAVDGNAHNGGAIRAYNEGWFSPEQAIIGGARFIGNSYIHNQYNQNTLYKMRWNPANPGYPQYATDIGWAVKQVPSIKRLYDMLNNPVFKFNITQYR